jgi:hypothetical protein
MKVVKALSEVTLFSRERVLTALTGLGFTVTGVGQEGKKSQATLASLNIEFAPDFT